MLEQKFIDDVAKEVMKRHRGISYIRIVNDIGGIYTTMSPSEKKELSFDSFVEKLDDKYTTEKCCQDKR